MKAKLFTKDLIFIDVIDISSISFKRQRNKEYTISCKPVTGDYNWEQVHFVYFLDDSEEKTKRIQYKPCGVLEGYSGDTLSIKSMEGYLENVSRIPENFEWWNNKLLENVVSDLCYGFRTIKKTSLTQMQDVVASNHVQFGLPEGGNGAVYADTDYYFSPSNIYELYYYSDGYAIYRIVLPEEARRQGIVLRWSDQTGTTTDVSVQFRWSDVSDDFLGEYSFEQSPLRGEDVRKNETVGVDVPESDKKYLFIKFNLKYDTGSTDIFPKGFNYEQEVTTVEGEGHNNYVYYGKTAILSAFEVIYRVDTRIQIGTISVSETQLMQADLSNCDNLLSVLKAICDAYGLTFFISFDNNILSLNIYNEYINDTTNQTIITDKINSKTIRKDIKIDELQAVDAFGAGDGFDRIHIFVKADDSETNIRNIGKYEGEETNEADLIIAAKAYIEKENEEISSASFEYYNMPLQVGDKVRVVIDNNVYTSIITEEGYNFSGTKVNKEYTIGIRKYAFSGMFTSPFSGVYLYKPEAPTNLIAKRMEQGWNVSWQGKTSKYLLQYRRGETNPWNTILVSGTNCNIPFTEYNKDYEFAVYAVNDSGQYSDAVYALSNSSVETLYIWETYYDGDEEPSSPTGEGNTGGWHRDLTASAKWVSKKEAHRITSGTWSYPVLTTNGVRLGVLNDTPDDVTGLIAYATRDGIQIECNAMGDGAKNVVSGFEFELLLEGASEWIQLSSSTNSVFYTFDRDTDGYPEADAIDGSQVRCKVKNTYGYYSTSYATATVSTDSYGTWITTAPSLSAYASKRDFTVSATQGYSSREIYGNIVYRVEIKRYDDTEYFKPNLTADPYASEDNYKDGSGYVTVTNYIQQRVPLETQDTNPQSTSYTYMFTTVNATTGVVGGSTTVTLIASASTAQDIVNHSMDAEKFNVQDLAAVSSVFGSIRSDGIAKDSTNFWNLSDPASALGYGEEGEMCVGTSASVEPYDPVNKPSGYKDNDSFFHFIPQTVGGVLKGLYMKLANFIITAINSTVTGTFIVLSRFTGKQLLRVSEEDNKVYGLQRQSTYDDIENVTRVSGIGAYDTLDITEGGGVIYGVTGEDEKLLAYNTATDTEVAIDCEAGDNFSVCQLVGDEVVCVGGDTIKGYNLTDNAWVKYTYAPITISAISKYRNTSQIYNGKLYCPNDNSTTMDIIDLSDNSYTSVTISTTNKQRFTSHIYNGKLYCPNSGSTMDIIDLSDNSYTSVTISDTNRYRYTSQIYNGKLYCPNNNSTTMDIIDLSDNSYTSVTISVINKPRNTSQIYNGKLYCPNYGSTTMDIIDLSDNSYTSVTISTTGEQRWTSQIYNGKLYCPIYNSRTMDIIDLSDNSYTSVTISTTNKFIYTSHIYNGKLYCPNNGSTTMDIIDLSDNSYTSVIISATNKERRTSHIYNNKIYCPNDMATTMDIIKLPLALADTHKTNKTYNNAHMYIVSANMVEKVGFLYEPNTQLTLTSMPTPLASCSNSTDVYVVDLASGRIAKINVTNAVTYTATTAKTGYLNYYCSGTTMYFTGRGAKVLKLNVTTGAQTEINLTTVLDNDLTYKVFYLSNYIYIFSQTSAVYFARVPTANFQLSAVEQYFLYNDIGNIRSRFWMGATTVYLAESRSGYMNKFTGVLLDQQVTRDVQKEIGSGFVEREVNANGVTTLATADGDEVHFLSDNQLRDGVSTVRASASFTLGTYPDGKKIRIANTHATSTITCTLPSGQTMNGQTSFTIAPDTILEFELIGTAWKCVSKEWEFIVAYTTGGVKDTSIAGYKKLKIDLIRYTTLNILTSLIITQIVSSDNIFSFYFVCSGITYKGGGYVRIDASTSKITELFTEYEWTTYSFGKLNVYGMK